MKDPIPRFRSSLAQWLDAPEDRIALYWKGRVALYAILRAMGVGKGDEVLMPAFTCVVVPNAVFYAGAKPRYVDIDPDTLNVPYERFEAAITDKTRAIIAQNTFGLSTEMDRIAELGRQKGIWTIEDCTHGFGGSFKGVPNGAYCDAAFYSTQWNKPFTTGLGGIARLGHESLKEALMGVHKERIEPTPKERMVLRGSLMARDLFLTPATYGILRKSYHWLNEAGLVPGSSDPQEVEDGKMPGDYFKGMSAVQAQKGIRELERLPERLARRQKAGERYTELLENRGKWHVPRSTFPDHAFLKYPLLVRDRDRFLSEAEKAGIPLGDWFLSPLHPVKEGLERWGLDRKAVPEADRIARKVVNLPTDMEDLEKAMRFLERRMDLVE